MTTKKPKVPQVGIAPTTEDSLPQQDRMVLTMDGIERFLDELPIEAQVHFGQAMQVRKELNELYQNKFNIEQMIKNHEVVLNYREVSLRASIKLTELPE
jgi:hypothetical protein